LSPRSIALLLRLTFTSGHSFTLGRLDEKENNRSPISPPPPPQQQICIRTSTSITDLPDRLTFLRIPFHCPKSPSVPRLQRQIRVSRRSKQAQLCSLQHLLPRHGGPQILPSFVQPPQVRVDTHPMGLQHVSQRSSLAHLRVQVLQAQDLPTLHQQSLTCLPLSRVTSEVCD
jgi:hypothetical protein